MRRLISTLIALSVTRAMLCGEATSPERREPKPLDLPAGGGAAEDEEDAAETIQFFGGSYEGDGFFFLLDVSGSMYGERLTVLKEEMRRSLESLSKASEFGIVAFSDWVRTYAQRPKRATRTETRRAEEWVEELRAIGGTYMLDGARTLLPIAHKSRKKHRVIIAVGDGLPTNPDPDETLVSIVSENAHRLPWNTILIGAGEGQEAFMAALARLTGGVYRLIEI